ncbi:MAG: class I SAM-dependent rRNA methyltransferase [Oscillospiraceae bacterium]|nr:class I SAM-dependent rRNA methyltransferase [Oscillospiraceae bacterium]
MKRREYPIVTISPKGERAARTGHPWVYGAEIRAVQGEPVNGELVDVCAQNGAYLGTGFYNDRSKITVRILSRNANDRFDAAFWRRRLEYAVNYRKTVMPGEDFSCCRLIHGEADQFPGLTVDRYNDLLVTETLCLGMEQIKDVLFPQLADILGSMGAPVSGIYERNESSIRKLEGLEQGKGWYPLEGRETPLSPLTEITENGIRYCVDVENGQKTGFFLDQKYNRQAVARLSLGRTVLDCFTHTGSFGLNAARGDAAHVTSVDISAEAIRMAEENARRNGLEDKITYQTANVFDLLTELTNNREKRYDFIILDPPAFTKSRQTIRNAARGYKEINLKAMKLLPRGGYLATCSCSHFMTDELFRDMLRAAASDAQVSLRQIEARQQSPDHPILWNVPETDYLKFYLFQVV